MLLLPATFECIQASEDYHHYYQQSLDVSCEEASTDFSSITMYIFHSPHILFAFELKLFILADCCDV